MARTGGAALTFDAAEELDDDDDDDVGGCDATENWDDGEECRDSEQSVRVWCRKCGNRPRPEHDFRCRLHNDALANWSTRPVAPLPPSDEASEGMSSEQWVRAMEAFDEAMAEYSAALNRWEPEWTEEADRAAPSDPPDAIYPLPCVRCRGLTALEGSKTTVVRCSIETLKLNTPWLPDDYQLASGADRVSTTTGNIGMCARCDLVISINVDSDE